MRRTSLGLGVMLLALIGVGSQACLRFGFSATARGEEDGGSRDGATGDGSDPDASQDAGAPELPHAVDGAAGDLGRDGVPALDLADAAAPPPPDGADDRGPAPDTAVPQPGCTASASVLAAYSGPMVLCQALAGGPLRDQCAAGDLCGPGWHLCTTSEYLARGGQATPALAPAWIAGCVPRNNSRSFAPVDGVCGDCAVSGASAIEVAWECDGSRTASFFSMVDFVGLSAESACMRAGVDGAMWAGYWRPRDTYSALSAAVCCQ